MRALPGSVLCALVASLAVVVPRALQAQTAPSRLDGSVAVDTDLEEIEEIIVHGRRFKDLRLEIERFQEAVFSRFNDINSTDDFDIVCRTDVSSLRRNRSCQPNFVRDIQAEAAAAFVRAWRNGTSENIAATLVLGQQARRLQTRMEEELRQLAVEDAQLRDAIADLEQAQFAEALARGTRTMSRQVNAASGSLPYGAELLFEIIMGNQPFQHRLTRRTFTIADVSGDVRKLEVQCREGRQRFDYTSGVEWTVPDGWRACTLEVMARRETTFRLYEF